MDYESDEDISRTTSLYGIVYFVKIRLKFLFCLKCLTLFCLVSYEKPYV